MKMKEENIKKNIVIISINVERKKERRKEKQKRKAKAGMAAKGGEKKMAKIEKWRENEGVM